MQIDQAQSVFRPGATSLLDDLDKRLLIILRDGRHLVGTLRSFDQYLNLILEDTCERMIGKGRYVDNPLGLYVVRGDSIVLMGEVDSGKDFENSALQKVELEDFYETEEDMCNEAIVQWDFNHN